MNYIQNLRKLVGKQPIIMVGAAVLLLNAEERLLLLRRTDNQLWGAPGGAMEPGESLEETARRETLEETSLVVGTLRFFGVFSGAELFYQYPDGAQVYNVTAVYTTREMQGDLLVDQHENTEYTFFDPAQLPDDVSPPIRPYLEAFSQKWRSGDRFS